MPQFERSSAPLNKGEGGLFVPPQGAVLRKVANKSAEVPEQKVLSVAPSLEEVDAGWDSVPDSEKRLKSRPKDQKAEEDEFDPDVIAEREKNYPAEEPNELWQKMTSKADAAGLDGNKSDLEFRLMLNRQSLKAAIKNGESPGVIDRWKQTIGNTKRKLEYISRLTEKRRADVKKSSEKTPDFLEDMSPAWLKRVQTSDEKGLDDLKQTLEFQLSVNRQHLKEMEEKNRIPAARTVRLIVERDERKIAVIDDAIAKLHAVPESGTVSRKRSAASPLELADTVRHIPAPEEVDDNDESEQKGNHPPTPQKRPATTKQLFTGELPAPPNPGDWRRQDEAERLEWERFARKKRNSEPPISGTRLKKAVTEEDLVLELDTRDEPLHVSFRDPSERLQAESLDAELAAERDAEEVAEDKRMDKIVSQDADVKRFRTLLAATPNTVEDIPERKKIQDQIRKAELLAEQREMERKERAAKKEREAAIKEQQSEEKKMGLLNEQIKKEEAARGLLQKTLEEKERQRDARIAQREQLVEKPQSVQRAKAEKALQQIQLAEDARQHELSTVNAVLAQNNVNDETRSYLDAERVRLMGELEKIGANRDVILKNVRATEGYNAPGDKGELATLIERDLEEVFEAERALGRHDAVIEDLKDQLSDVKMEHQRYAAIARDAERREDAAKMSGIEVAMALGGLAAVLLDPDEMPVVEPVVEAPAAVVDPVPEIVPLSRAITFKEPAAKGGRFRKSGKMAAIGATGILAGLTVASKGVDGILRFVERTFDNLYKLSMDPGKYLEGIQSRFNKEMSEEQLLGFGRGMKWLFLGDEKKKKKEKDKE